LLLLVLADRGGSWRVTTACFPFAALGRAHAYGATDGTATDVADRASGDGGPGLPVRTVPVRRRGW